MKTASYDELGSYVAGAHLPTLLAALTHLTGDTTLLREEFRPTGVVTPLGFEPQGGMSQSVQARARDVCVRVLIDILEKDLHSPQATNSEIRDVLEFTFGPLSDDYLGLLGEELAAPQDGSESRRTWKKTDVAPEREFRVAIIGAGMSGIAIAQRLQEADIPFTIFERQASFGGVWLANQYPGCRLDTSNFSYSYSFKQKGDWEDLYSQRDDVLKYLQEVADELNLGTRTKFGQRVSAVRFDDAEQIWRLTSQGESGTELLEFHAVVSAVGQLNSPRIPNIDGFDSFNGQSWHTANWPDHTSLEGKRVGVVGVGASAFQAIQQVAPLAQSVTVFQRTPPWVLPSPGYLDPIPSEPAWLLRNVPLYACWHRIFQFWASVDSRRRFAQVDPKWHEIGSVSADNEALRKLLVANVEAHLGDRPDLLEKCIPDYPPYGKRALRDGGNWFKTLKRDNVDLITTPIHSATSAGLTDATGKEHEFDIILFGTGFHASDFLSTIEVHGSEGRSLHDYWGGDARAYYGTTIPHFPNLFCVYGPNTNLLANGSVVFFSECSANYIMSALRQLLDTGQNSLSVRAGVLETYYEELDRANSMMAYGQEGVSSWYKNSFGRVSGNWPLNSVEYWRGTRKVDCDEYHYA